MSNTAFFLRPKQDVLSRASVRGKRLIPSVAFNAPCEEVRAAQDRLVLRSVWNVFADSIYHASFSGLSPTSMRDESSNRSGLIAIRTHSGRGRLTLKACQTIEVGAGSLVILNSATLLHCSCRDSRWIYWGFGFESADHSSFPLGELLSAPYHDEEGALVSSLIGHFRSGDDHKRRIAQVKFQTLLQDWLHGTTRADHDAAATDGCSDPIGIIISEMHNRLDGSLTVSRMAAMVRLSESHFRRRFCRVMGVTPKKLYDQLRMAWADEALRCGRMNVTEVAYALGFCSPFHFSRVFRRHFGCPPSHRILVHRDTA